MPKVSVIIPTFNRSELLVRAIDSVLNQSFQDFELVVVDDGSTDSTFEALKIYKNIIYLKQQNLGVSAARNKGVEVSSGELIAFLDSDDEWLPEKLQKQIDFLKDNPKLKWCYTDETWIRSGVLVNKKKKHQKSGGDLFKPSLELCLIAPSSVLIRKSLMDRYKFREDFKVCEDFDLWLKFLTCKAKKG